MRLAPVAPAALLAVAPAIRAEPAQARRVAASSTPHDFATFINNDYAKWRRVVREAGIKVE